MLCWISEPVGFHAHFELPEVEANGLTHNYRHNATTFVDGNIIAEFTGYEVQETQVAVTRGSTRRLMMGGNKR
jgi:hypothetical protein